MSTEKLFDGLTRLAASGLPRRRMITLTLGSLAAAVFGRRAFASPTCSGGKVRDNGGTCCDPDRIGTSGYCCPTGKSLDSQGYCCMTNEIDASGHCCNASDGRHLDPAGNCCASFDQFGNCKNLFPACTGETCETFIPCSLSNSDCVCGSVANGGGFCVPGSTPCGGLPDCVNNNDCAEGSICLVNTCCGAGVCISVSLECPANSDAKKKSNKTTTGPTIGHR